MVLAAGTPEFQSLELKMSQDAPHEERVPASAHEMPHPLRSILKLKTSHFLRAQAPKSVSSSPCQT